MRPYYKLWSLPFELLNLIKLHIFMLLTCCWNTWKGTNQVGSWLQRLIIFFFFFFCCIFLSFYCSLCFLCKIFLHFDLFSFYVDLLFCFPPLLPSLSALLFNSFFQYFFLFSFVVVAFTFYLPIVRNFNWLYLTWWSDVWSLPLLNFFLL